MELMEGGSMNNELSIKKTYLVPFLGDTDETGTT